MSDYVLLLGARLMGGSYIEAIHREGRRALVIDGRAQLDRWNEVWDDAIVVNEESDEDWVRAATAAARSHKIVGVVAYSDDQVIAAAVVADLLGLPGPGLLASIASRNKSTIRSVNVALDIPQPTALVTPFDGLDELGGPDAAVVVQKVLGGSGSEGVQMVSKDEAPLPHDEPVILEEYVQGAYYSSELFVADGVVCFTNHTAKTTGGPPEFVDFGHVVGVRLPATVADEAETMLEGLVAGYQISWGVVHVEWIAAAGRLAVIEFAVRTPGDFLMYGIERAHGFDAFGAVVRASIGLEPKPAEHPCGRAAATFFPRVPGDPAVARKVLEERWGHAELFVGKWRPESAPDLQRSSDDRHHHVLVVGADEGTVRDLARQVERDLAAAAGPTNC